LPEFADENSKDWVKVASNGFDTSTRLASGAAEVWLPILLQNSEFVANALRSLGQNIALLADSLSNSNTIPLRTQMERARKTRTTFESKQKSKSENFELIYLTK